jgi:putative ABC transport system substrate-binding protein
MSTHVKRRKFIAMLGGAAATPLVSWPLEARAQQREPMRRIGIILPAAADDMQYQAWVGAFLQTLALSGWTLGSNVRIESRWATAEPDEIGRQAADLVALAPDIILAFGNSTVAPVLHLTRTIPVVFPVVADPVGSGLVESLARPGGNATGFMTAEFSMGGKRLELLKQVAPSVTRAAVLRDINLGSSIGEFAAIQAVAPSLSLEVTPISMRDADEIERGIETFARAPHGGLIVTAGATAQVRRELIVALAARHRLPAVYFQRIYVTVGGLLSYAPDFMDQFRRAAGYVDRILRGEKPGDLPVQAPTKYEMVVNLKTAKALGLDVPTTVLARADEVIE